jgi:HNH endonuclease
VQTKESTMSRKSLSPSLRLVVFERDGFTCRYCGRRPSTGEDVVLEVDHLIPVAEGGTNDLHNLVTSCWDCNRGKSDRILRLATTREELAEQELRLQERNRQLEQFRKFSERVYRERRRGMKRIREHWLDVLGSELRTIEAEGLANKLQLLDLNEILEAISITARKGISSHVDAIKYTHAILNKWRDDPSQRPLARYAASPPPALPARQHEAVVRPSAEKRRRMANPAAGAVQALVPAAARVDDVQDEEEAQASRQAEGDAAEGSEQDGVRQFDIVALFERPLPPGEGRYLLKRWHVDTNYPDEWRVVAESVEVPVPTIHHAAAFLPQDAMSLASKDIDAEVQVGDTRLVEMDGYLSSWMVPLEAFEGLDPEKNFAALERGAHRTDIRSWEEGGWYVYALSVDVPQGRELAGFVVSRGLASKKGSPKWEEDLLTEARGFWTIHEALALMPPPEHMLPSWYMAPEELHGVPGGALAAWYVPAESVERGPRWPDRPAAKKGEGKAR